MVFVEMVGRNIACNRFGHQHVQGVALPAGLAHLGERGIGVVILSGRKAQPTLFFGRPHNDARLRVQQTRCSLDDSFCLAYARQLVHSKIERQHQWLDPLRKRYPQARYALTQAIHQLQEQQTHLPRARNLESLRGHEGAAASTA